VLNDPYLDRSAATTISQTDDDDFCKPIQCNDEDEPDFQLFNCKKAKGNEDVRKGLNIEKRA
jgi:hypothetical protein